MSRPLKKQPEDITGAEFLNYLREKDAEIAKLRAQVAQLEDENDNLAKILLKDAGEYRASVDRLERDVHNLSRERSICVSLIAKLARDLSYDVALQPSQHEEGIWLCYISLRGKQICWHITEEEKEKWFAGIREIPAGRSFWDGHDTKEKYARVLRY